VNWLETLLDRGREAKGTASTDPLPVLQKPAKPRAQPDIKAVSVQTAAPSGSSPGAITVGYYSVEDDVVVMHDASGKPTGQRMPAGEDPRQVAYLITRESWKAEKPDFNRPLNYRPLSIG
jgi:hypothetical protein